MILTEIIQKKSEALNEIPNIKSIPDISNPPNYLQLFFKKRFIGYCSQEEMQINNPLFRMVHNPTYKKIKKIILD